MWRKPKTIGRITPDLVAPYVDVLKQHGIINFYNTQRPHMSIGMQTPEVPIVREANS